MNKLYRKLVVLFIIVTAILLLISLIAIVEVQYQQNAKRLLGTLQNSQVIIRDGTVDYFEWAELLKEDYLNRAGAVEYILSKDQRASD